MSRTKGTFSLTSNIEPKFGAPLDARTIVKLLADLTASNTFEYPYKGMKVFVEENNKSYTLVGSDPTVSTNWIEDNSGGGHTIKNPAGTAMTQRSNLQFVDLTVSDDSTNDATKVESVHVIQSESELENLPDGLYMLDEDEGTVLDASAVGYDNTDSELDAENVQDAIDEVVETLDDKIDISAKGVANGVAELDSTGKVPSSQLPSFVDDVIEVADYDHLPTTGETGKIYVTLDANKTYRWGGTEYVEISESLALGETSSTAYRGDRGKIAYDHSQLTSGNPHNVTKSEVGLGNVDNTSDSTKKTNFTGSIASGNTGFVTGGDAYAALNNKADKVSSATNGNLAGLNGSGNPTDSGISGDMTTQSATGNPISIPNLKSAQIALNPIITYNPIQEGSGTPSPSNIRAISGYDKIEVLSCGKNLFDKTRVELGQINQTTGEDESASNIYRYKGYIYLKPNTKYTIGKNNGQTLRVFFYSQNGYLNTSTYTGTVTTFDTGNTIRRIRFQSAEFNTIKEILQVEEGTSATTYVPYVKATSISESLGQTVYGGTLDVRTGKFKVLGKAVDLGNLDYSYRGDIVTGVFSNSVVNDYVLSLTVKALCEKYNFFGTVPAVQSMADVPDKSFALYYQTGQTATALYIKDTSYNNATTFKASLSGVKLVYELATPFTIQLTPHEISLLKDYAYVSTNGTSIALDYHNGELASLADVAQVGETVNELGQYVTSTSLLNGLIHSKEITVTTNASGLANINMDSRKVCIINMFIKSNTTVHYIALVDIYQINSYIVKALNGADLTPVANQSITIVVYYYNLA